MVSKINSAGVDAYRIRSYPRPRDEIDPAPYGHKWTIFEGARGTCATPLYLSPLTIQCGHATFAFQDAGFSGFNNPAKVAMDEAKKVFGTDATITLVSVGTGLRSLIDAGLRGSSINKVIKDEHIDTLAQQILAKVGELGRNMRNAPQVAKRLAKQLLDVATDTEISHLHMYEQFRSLYAGFQPEFPLFAYSFRRGQRRNYHRFNPPQGLGDIELTDYRQEATISSITDAWLKSPAGQAKISSATDNLRVCM